ncbi:MAG: 4-alpha-glucanotransferase [Elusimicrobia bacterium]|nr:4-alpha-glucanotransferase [Elusimicrobiota bacterium]
MHPLLEKKHTGILFPLFSMRSKKDWGIGDISAMALWFDSFSAMGIDLLQVLPVNEMPPGVSCPYTALSAFAIDPIYIAVPEIEELAGFPDLAGEMRSHGFQTEIRNLRRSKHVLYEEVRHLKFAFLWKIYTHFHERHILKDTQAAKDFFAFTKENSAWLDDYALFRRLKDTHNWSSWTHWETPLKTHDGAALKELESREENQVLYFKYLQWLVHRQWKKARLKAASLNIKILGDLPFMVNQESSDVWARQAEFDISKEVGAPPDAFSETGQKWGLPAYNWPEIEKNNFDWWRSKVKKAADFYDFFRIDHMVGFFRTWVIPHDAAHKADFDIKDEKGQRERGERFLKAVISAGPMLPVAEDLGLIPKFVYQSLSELGVPGYKVMRWEKEKDGNYRSPENYPRVSLATTSTHDNEPLADWWDTVDHVEKKLFWKMISGEDSKPPAFHKAQWQMLRKILKAASAIVVLPMQDIMGIKDRVNTPSTLGLHNWTWRFNTPAEHFLKKHAGLVCEFKKLVGEERK